MSTRAVANHRRRFVMVAFAVSVGIQAVLIILGLAYILAPSTSVSFVLLLVWCVIGTLYVIGTWCILAAASRWAETDEPPIVEELSTPSRVVSLIATVLVSAVGVVATVQHIVPDPDTASNRQFDFVVVWAMILAWMLLHWGFSQLYTQQYYLDADRPLSFPNSEMPGILEFAYFSYTVGVSFAVSDVEVRDRRVRFLVLVHAVLSFFFNGLIIVTALNAITSAGS